MNKVLIIKNDCDNFEKYFIRKMQSDGIEITPVYTSFNFIGEFLKLIHLHIKKIKVPFKEFWYGEWKKKIQCYQTVILFDRIMNMDIIEYIRKNNQTCRIIFWCWNTIQQNNIEKYKKICEFWSFDKQDCIKYNLNFNTQFYIPEVQFCNSKIIYDAFFIGRAKGRIREIYKCKKILENNGFETLFYIVKNEYRKKQNYLIKEKDYEDILKVLQQTKCIIEIVQCNQVGLSIRVMESLFYSKKIITNNKNIVQEEFYNKQNIFVLGLNDEIFLKTFLETPYKKIDEKIIKKYSYQNWLSNFKL